MPGPGALKSFLKAAAKRDVSAALIREAREAGADFERLSRVHAGNPASLKMMLTACATDRNAADIKHKKMAFQGNSYIYGIQARTRLAACFLQPGTRRGQIDIAWLCGHVDLCWLRSNARWIVSTGKNFDTADRARDSAAPEPIDDEVGRPSLPLLRSFCSDPLPRFRRVETAPGVSQTEFLSNGIGNTAAVTYFTGEVTRSAASSWRDEHHTHRKLGVSVHVPAEVLILDVMIRDDTFGPIRPEVVVHRGTSLGGIALFSEADKLHLCESVTHLGRGPSVLHTANVPSYSKIAGHIFDRLGWDGSRFDVYRCQVQYPVVPSTVRLQFELPESPVA